MDADFNEITRYVLHFYVNKEFNATYSGLTNLGGSTEGDEDEAVIPSKLDLYLNECLWKEVAEVENKILVAVRCWMSEEKCCAGEVFNKFKEENKELWHLFDTLNYEISCLKPDELFDIKESFRNQECPENNFPFLKMIKNCEEWRAYGGKISDFPQNKEFDGMQITPVVVVLIGTIQRRFRIGYLTGGASQEPPAINWACPDTSFGKLSPSSEELLNNFDDWNVFSRLSKMDVFLELYGVACSWSRCCRRSVEVREGDRRDEDANPGSPGGTWDGRFLEGIFYDWSKTESLVESLPVFVAMATTDLEETAVTSKANEHFHELECRHLFEKNPDRTFLVVTLGDLEGPVCGLAGVSTPDRHLLHLDWMFKSEVGIKNVLQFEESAGEVFVEIQNPFVLLKRIQDFAESDARDVVAEKICQQLECTEYFRGDDDDDDDDDDDEEGDDDDDEEFDKSDCLKIISGRGGYDYDSGGIQVDGTAMVKGSSDADEPNFPAAGEEELGSKIFRPREHSTSDLHRPENEHSPENEAEFVSRSTNGVEGREGGFDRNVEDGPDLVSEGTQERQQNSTTQIYRTDSETKLVVIECLTSFLNSPDSGLSICGDDFMKEPTSKFSATSADDDDATVATRQGEEQPEELEASDDRVGVEQLVTKEEEEEEERDELSLASTCSTIDLCSVGGSVQGSGRMRGIDELHKIFLDVSVGKDANISYFFAFYETDAEIERIIVEAENEMMSGRPLPSPDRYLVYLYCEESCSIRAIAEVESLECNKFTLRTIWIRRLDFQCRIVLNNLKGKEQDGGDTTDSSSSSFGRMLLMAYYECLPKSVETVTVSPLIV